MRFLAGSETPIYSRMAKWAGDYLGRLTTPAACHCPERLSLGLPWAVDNGAFAGFDPPAFRRYCDRIGRRNGLMWVACPDVVGDWIGTRKLFDEWEPWLHDRERNLPVACVLQDGCRADEVPWDRIEAVFVGGSTEWKLGQDAERLVRDAKSRGLLAHMGRVNTRKRVRHALEIGCDSIDGMGISRYADVYLPKYVQWVKSMQKQKTLDAGGVW